jgi:hypothetical protein
MPSRSDSYYKITTLYEVAFLSLSRAAVVSAYLSRYFKTKPNTGNGSSSIEK